MACHISVSLSIYPSTVPLSHQSTDPFQLTGKESLRKEFFIDLTVLETCSSRLQNDYAGPRELRWTAGLGQARSVWSIRLASCNQINQTDRIDYMNKEAGGLFQHPAINTKGGRSSKLLPPSIPVKPFTTYSAAGCNEDKASRS